MADHQHNEASQRIRATLADGSCWRYEYDALGQLQHRVKYFADDYPVPGGRFDYTWDPENRLIKMESRSEAPNDSKRKLESACEAEPFLCPRAVLPVGDWNRGRVFQAW